MVKITMRNARRDLAQTAKQAGEGERVVIYRHKKPVAVMVSVEDYRLLRAIEDQADLKDALEALKEPGSIPWEQVKAELGLS